MSLCYSKSAFNSVGQNNYGKRRGHTRNFAKVPPSLKPERYQVLLDQNRPKAPTALTHPIPPIGHTNKRQKWSADSPSSPRSPPTGCPRRRRCLCGNRSSCKFAASTHADTASTRRERVRNEKQYVSNPECTQSRLHNRSHPHTVSSPAIRFLLRPAELQQIGYARLPETSVWG